MTGLAVLDRTNPWVHAAAQFAAPTVTADPYLAALEDDWERWVTRILPGYATAPFGGHHRDFWVWLWSIEADDTADPFVGIWARGGAKSTSAEAGCVAVGCRRRRRYVLYVSETQDQADGHVENIGDILESSEIEDMYPDMADRAVGKYGSSKGWRRNRLRTRSGFTVDAIGLDKGTRGLKVEDQRPDYIVLDDIDDHEDTLAAIERKVGLITKRILPAGAPNVVVLAIQNLVHPAGVFARLAGLAPADEIPSDFLVGRRLSGPIPALDGAAFDRDPATGDMRIVAGTPTWAGQDLVTCQRFVDTYGLTAFSAECQHDLEPPSGGMYTNVEWAHCRFDELPDLISVAVWVDPAVTNTDRSDSQGIQVDALGADDCLYRLASWEGRTSPRDALKRAFRFARLYRVSKVGVETDQGGDTWQDTWGNALAEVVAEDGWPDDLVLPQFDENKAGAGQGSKTERSARMLADYERPGRRIVHVTTGPGGEIGSHQILERALRRFPRSKPFDLADAAYWGWYDLASEPLVPVPMLAVTGKSGWS